MDLWLKDLAPSTALRTWFQHDPGRWKVFQRRYATELDRNDQAVEELWGHVQKGPVTLLYGAHNQECNHAVALKTYLTKKYA